MADWPSLISKFPDADKQMRGVKWMVKLKIVNQLTYVKTNGQNDVLVLHQVCCPQKFDFFEDHWKLFKRNSLLQGECLPNQNQKTRAREQNFS